jgi:hypothetical protein
VGKFVLLFMYRVTIKLEDDEDEEQEHGNKQL